MADLVIPARDEAPNVASVFRSLPWSALRRVVLVDNGSRDATAQLAREAGAAVVHEPQPGYGAACLAGLRWLTAQPAPSPVVAFLDADGADDPGRLPELIEAVASGAADLAIASRPRLAAPGALTPPQRLGNALACGVIRALTGTRYTDLGPMRAIRADALRELEMRDRTWGWTVEMQYKAAAAGLRVTEIAVPYRPRRAGASKISGTISGTARAGTKILFTLGRLWWASRGRGAGRRVAG